MPKKIESKQPIISILPGSRKQEISKILAKVLKVCKYFPNYRFVIAGVNHIHKKTYQKIYQKSLMRFATAYSKLKVKYLLWGLVNQGTLQKKYQPLFPVQDRLLVL